jgi:hypothetical protein
MNLESYGYNTKTVNVAQLIYMQFYIRIYLNRFNFFVYNASAFFSFESTNILKWTFLRL